MYSEFDEYLHKSYPIFCDDFYNECLGDGWNDIIDNTCKLLEEKNHEYYEYSLKVILWFIKGKFCQLRISYSIEGDPDSEAYGMFQSEIERIIRNASVASETVCEFCGKTKKSNTKCYCRGGF